jgi:hypothetical protein
MVTQGEGCRRMGRGTRLVYSVHKYDRGCPMRVLITAICLGTAVALAAPPVQGIGVPAKTKAKKVQANLVPAMYPADTGRGTGDDEGDDPAFLDTATPRSNCIFDAGKVKLQVGKDASVKIKGVRCGGTPYSGSLCAHSKILSSIMSEEIDKSGNSTPVVCNSTAGDIAGDMNFVTGNHGLLTCSAGSCEGTLPPVTTDPCPDVDKVTAVRRFEVFDGPDFANIPVLGTNLKACCGPGQTLVGGILASGAAPCNTSTQDVMAELGTINHGIQP